MKKFFLLFCSALLTLGAFAEEACNACTDDQPAFEEESFESDWTVSVGVSYRNFKNPRFHGTKTPGFTDYVLDEDRGEFVEPTQANLQSALNARRNSTAGGVYRLTFGSFEGASSSGKGSYGKGEKMAPAIGLSKNVWVKDALDLDLVIGFQAFELDSAAHFGGKGAKLDTYDYYVYAGNSFVVNNLKMDASAKRIPAVNAMGKAKMDMNLYVLDLGLSLGSNFDNGARVFVAAGPTLTLTDLNSSAYAGASHRHDDSTDLTLGCYAAAGADFWFTEAVGLAAELRYDLAFGQVKTRFVKQNLDGFGGQLKLKYRF
ncbi:MAG: hypothetical protein MJ202_03555 [Lentisphaeria bacterium]|nr:hypothetical protein [Lentisphaeria bacterium]